MMVWLPRAHHEEIERKATEWKEQLQKGQEHVQKCMCLTARLRAFLTILLTGLAAGTYKLDDNKLHQLKYLSETVAVNAPEDLLSKAELAITRVSPLMLAIRRKLIAELIEAAPITGLS